MRRKYKAGKAIPLQASTGPEGLRRLKLPNFRQSAHESDKVVSPTYRPPLLQETFLVLISVRGWVDPSATGRIMSMKKFNDTIGNRTRDLSTCSAVPQPTAPSRKASKYSIRKFENINTCHDSCCGLKFHNTIFMVYLSRRCRQYVAPNVEFFSCNPEGHSLKQWCIYFLLLYLTL
jgi:hypothetical protein